MAQVTVTIAPAVETIGLQTIAVALGLNNVTDEQARVALGAHLKNVTGNLYLQGDRILRVNAADAAALAAAAEHITVT